MSAGKERSLLDCVLDSSRETDPGNAAFIVFDDVQTFDLLAGETVRFAVDHADPDVILLVDSDTAEREVATLSRRRNRERTAVLGKAVSPVHVETAGQSPDRAGGLKPEDRLVLVCSAHVGLVLIGKARPHAFQACWSGNRHDARQVLERFFPTLEFSKCTQQQERRGDSTQDYANLVRMTSVLLAHLTQRHHDVAMDRHDLRSVLDILKAISAERRCHDVLFVFVEQIARLVDTTRCSVVRIWNEAQTGNVLASHDNARLNDLIIDLSKYPEITHALATGKTVVIDDVGQDPLVRTCLESLRKAHIHSLLVAPIVLHDVNVGSLLLRAARSDRSFTSREIGFCEIVAEAAANALERAHLFEKIQRTNERLEHLAVTDDLTGLRNHRAFREHLEREFERARRYGHGLSILLIDVDNFKAVNDTFGHLQGDKVLRELAWRVLRMTRKTDVAARYGGEEIVIIMPQTSLDGAYAQACRLLAEVRKARYAGLPADFSITVSIGVATLNHDTMTDCEALIRLADSALYEAKRKGKNRVVTSTNQGEH